MQLAKSDGRQIWAFVFGEGIFYHTVFTCATAIVCLNSAFTPFNHQSSKSCFNYEPCLFLPLNSIRTNKRAFSAIMGLSIGWQPETLCMFVSGYVRVRKLSHVWMCYCVSVGIEQFETDKLKDIWGVCVCVCVSVLSGVLSMYMGAVSEGLKEWSIKLPCSLSLIECVTGFTDEFWAFSTFAHQHFAMHTCNTPNAVKGVKWCICLSAYTDLQGYAAQWNTFGLFLFFTFRSVYFHSVVRNALAWCVKGSSLVCVWKGILCKALPSQTCDITACDKGPAESNSLFFFLVLPEVSSC